jgi:RNA polymerase sigma-70 factor (ECF subfamily)
MEKPLRIESNLERFRAYLHLLACSKVDPRLRAKLDISGVVQQTMLEAFQAVQTEGAEQSIKAAWLRQILANNLRDEIRKLRGARRDVTREKSLEAGLEESSARLDALLAAPQSSPSQKAQASEQALELAEALGQLPEAQREAVVLQHWHGWSLAQIAEHLHRTPAAVAGLLHRALKQLRKSLDRD